MIHSVQKDGPTQSDIPNLVFLHKLNITKYKNLSVRKRRKSET